MSISGLQSVANNYQQNYVQNAASKVPETAEPAKKAETTEAAAVYEKSPKVESGDYSEKVSRMLAESQRKVAEFQNMFARYLGGQASMYGISTWSKDRMTAAFAKATPEEVSAAKAAIAEGGYYSVNAVSDRAVQLDAEEHRQCCPEGKQNVRQPRRRECRKTDHDNVQKGCNQRHAQT